MWPNPQKTANLVTFTEENLNGKLHFLYSVNTNKSVAICIHLVKKSLRENSPYLEFFLVYIFWYLNRSGKFAELSSVFSRSADNTDQKIYEFGCVSLRGSFQVKLHFCQLSKMERFAPSKTFGKILNTRLLVPLDHQNIDWVIAI